MTTVRITDPAWTDLATIFKYIADRGTPLRAAEVIEKILNATERLNEFPESGRIRYDVDPTTHSIGWGPYVIFYRITKGRQFADVARVIDGRRNLALAFKDVSYLIAA